MDFTDELPCGGYQQQDKKIQNNLEKLSLQSEGKIIVNTCQCAKKCQQSCEKSGCQKCTKQQPVNNKPKYKKKIQCKKCKENQAVLVHKNEQICKQCLMKSIEYKTRLNLQNNIKVKPKSRLLICFSGGLNSICLVQILAKIKKRYQKSPLFGYIQCIHIQQQQKLPDHYLQNFQKITQTKLKIIPISQVYGKEQKKQIKDVQNLFQLFKKNSNSIDLLTLLRNKLIIDYAKQNNFEYILMAKNGQSLAAQIFKYFTKGIGGSSPQLSSNQTGPFQYPLRQHLQKQLQYYFYHEKLGALSMKAQSDDLSYIAYNEIDSYLDNFIITLQDRYSHTAPAIVRTSQKIKSNFDNQKQCKWCWLNHDRPGSICQKCVRLNQSIKDQQIRKRLPDWLII